MLADSKAKNVAILGAGSWGLTLSWLFASDGKPVRLYTRDTGKAESIDRVRHVERPITVTVPAEVMVSSDLTACLKDAHFVIFCSTSQSIRLTAQKVADCFHRGVSGRPVLVSAVKGLELQTIKRMTEVLEEVLPDFPVCSLSGPNLAQEILMGLPSAAVVAGRSATVARLAQESLSTQRFRLYSSTDVIGVELGGTLKNVIAIAAGATDGLRLGANAKAALLTRGLAEMTRLAVRLGAEPLTLSGLSGMGDLFATCSATSSRNYRLGMELASGRGLAEILRDLEVVVEGVPTTRAVCELSKRLQLELPIARQVQATLDGTSTAQEAIMTLMGRPLSSEWY